MKCPVCKTYEHTNISLKTDGFDEDIIKCPTCDTEWSISHGLTEIINDAQVNSFLSVGTECVEADDYMQAA